MLTNEMKSATVQLQQRTNVFTEKLTHTPVLGESLNS